MSREALPPPVLTWQSEFPDGTITIVRVYVLSDGRKVVRSERRPG